MLLMTQIDAKLFNALTATADRTLPRASAIAVYAAAAQLAAAPKLAEAWARVLTEHTAPESLTDIRRRIVAFCDAWGRPADYDHSDVEAKMRHLRDWALDEHADRQRGVS